MGESSLDPRPELMGNLVAQPEDLSRKGLALASDEADTGVLSVGDTTNDDRSAGLSLVRDGLPVSGVVNGPGRHVKPELCRPRRSLPCPSRLSQEYACQNLDEPRVPNVKIEDCSIGQHCRNDSTALHVPSYEARQSHYLPGYDNAMFFGLHKESSERTRMVRDNTNWQQGEPKTWPASPMQRYKFPLSYYLPPATSIVRRSPQSHNTSSNIDTAAFPVPNFPPPAISPVITPQSRSLSFLQPEAHQSRYNNTQMNPTGYDTLPPMMPSITVVPQRNQLSTSIGVNDIAQSPPSSVTMAPSTQHNARKTHSVSKKRSRAVEADSHTAGNTVPTNQEKFHDPTRVVLTAEDLSYVNILIAAMNDMNATEDNDGMIKSWGKIRALKAAKINRVCEDMLVSC